MQDTNIIFVNYINAVKSLSTYLDDPGKRSPVIEQWMYKLVGLYEMLKMIYMFFDIEWKTQNTLRYLTNERKMTSQDYLWVNVCLSSVCLPVCSVSVRIFFHVLTLMKRVAIIFTSPYPDII